MTCGLCKLAMHWRTIIYCLDNGIKYVSDGSGKEMYVDPSQHSAVIPEMRKLYKRFGIQYLSPSFDTSPEEREGVLFKMGISERQVIKWTDATWELQPICSQEYLHLLHVQYKCKKRIFQLRDLQPDYLKYEKRMLDFHKHKREKLVWLIERYIAANKIVTS